MSTHYTENAVDHLYLGISQTGHPERHLSMFAQLEGLEALCGQRLVATRPVPMDAVHRSVTCDRCRVVMFHRSMGVRVA